MYLVVHSNEVRLNFVKYEDAIIEQVFGIRCMPEADALVPIARVPWFSLLTEHVCLFFVDFFFPTSCTAYPTPSLPPPILSYVG